MATFDIVRHIFRTKFEKVLHNKARALNVEVSAYNYSIEMAEERKISKTWNEIRFRKLYLNKCRNLYLDLENPQTQLAAKIQNKEISTQTLAYLTAVARFPGLWEPVFRALAKKKGLSIKDDESYEGMFKCPKCNSKKTSYYSLQTRSADEPMTNFISCTVCDNHWKD